MKVAGGKRKWLANVTAYSLAGGVASGLVGAILGALGGVLSLNRIGAAGFLVAAVVGMLAIARELGWLSVPLPQLARQTRDVWGKILPGPLAAALWGFDLGLLFTTWLTFPGVWLLAAVTLLVGNLAIGAVLFVLYWLGRALSVWLAPLLLPGANGAPQLLEEIGGRRRLFQGIHVMGLAWSIVVLIVWFIRGVAL